MKGFLSDEKIADYVWQDVLWGRDFRDERTQDWLRFYRLYKGYIDQAKYPFDANLSIPTAYSNIEVQVSFLIDMIHEAGSFIEVLGKTDRGQVTAPAIKALLNYHFTNSFDLYQAWEKFIRQLLMYGTSIFKVFYDYRREWKTRYVPKYDQATNEIMEFNTELSSEETSNQPTGYTVDLWNFGFDPHCSDLDNARFAFEEIWLDANTLKERAELGLLNEKAVHQVLSGSADDPDVNEGLDERMQDIEVELFQRNPHAERGKVHCVEYWGYVTKGWQDGKLGKNSKRQLIHVIMTAGSSTSRNTAPNVVLLAEPSPFHHNKIPYIDARINAPVGEFYGTGDIEMCESLYIEQRDHRNMKMDNLSRSINQMWLVDSTQQIDLAQLVTRPHGIIETPDIEAIKPLQIPPLDPSHFRAEDEIRRDIELVTGVNDFVLGQYRSSTGFNDTATGISLIQQTALKRLGQKGQIVQRSIRDVAIQVFALIQQFQPRGTQIRVLDNENRTRIRFIDVSPQALMHSYDFNVVNAPALGSKQFRIQELMQLLQIVVQTQAAGGMSEPVSRLYKRIIEEMDIPNPQELAGYPGFNQPIPNLGMEAGSYEEVMSPEDENLMMVDEKKQAYAKSGEDHEQHILVHGQAKEAYSSDIEISNMIQEHILQHHHLMEQEKNVLANVLATNIEGASAMAQQQQAALMSGQARPRKDLKSPTGANGQENIMRQLGALMSGNG